VIEYKTGPITRELFMAAAESGHPDDQFARGYFRYTLDSRKSWGLAVGAFTPEGELAAAGFWVVNKTLPKTCNLHLIHSFAKFRGKGAGAFLYGECIKVARAEAEYFRVSVNPPAKQFYEKMGCKFWGTQKSGTYFAMFRLRDDAYDRDDPVIYNAIHKKGAGSVHVLSDFYHNQPTTRRTLFDGLEAETEQT
jgi:GNAT superfamily N-acetyltransferase